MRDDTGEATPAKLAFPVELLIWLSPAFPVGGFAFSQGLETAIERGWINDAATLENWLEAVVLHGSISSDLILMSNFFRTETNEDLRHIAELAAALQPSAERALEALEQGQSFLNAYKAGWLDRAPSQTTITALLEAPPTTLAITLAAAARDYAIPPNLALEAYATAAIGNLLSAAIRIGIIGQFDAQRIQARLTHAVHNLSSRAGHATLSDLGNATYGADMSGALHETQLTRLFRS